MINRLGRRLFQVAKIVLACVITMAVFAAQSFGVNAMGAVFTNEYFQIAPTEVKALVFISRTEETLIVSSTFNFNPLLASNFVILMVLPEKPTVKVLQDDVFLEFDKLAKKQFQKNNLVKKIIYADIFEEKNILQDTFSQAAYLKGVYVFAPGQQRRELNKLLQDRGLLISKTSRSLLTQYEKKGWYFVAILVDGAHLVTKVTDTLTLRSAHTIPVQLTFKSKGLTVPLKVMTLQPDIDAKNLPLSFPYGSDSRDILGVEDERVDNLISTLSAKENPSLPLDLAFVKLDFFVIGEHKTTAQGFFTTYAERIDKEKLSLLQIPFDQPYVTRLISFRPMTQLTDLSLTKASDDGRVNPHITGWESLIRGELLMFSASSGLYFIFKKFFT